MQDRKSIKSEIWDSWDQHVQATVQIFNSFLAGKGLFFSLDWRIIKTMLWVESGPSARNNMWNIRPLQIGNPGDMGLSYFLTSTQAKLTTPPRLYAGLNAQNIATEPRCNIVAGIGYLMVKMARFGAVLDPLPSCDARSYLPLDEKNSIVGSVEHSIGGCVMDKLTGDRISVRLPLAPLNAAHSHHSRHTHQPALRALHRKSHMGIVGWLNFNDWTVIYKRYNGGGDENYPAKLKFANAVLMGKA